MLKRFLKFTKVLLCSLTIVALCVSQTFALTAEQADYYNLNNIRWYDADSNMQVCFNPASLNVAGSTAAEKVWSGLISVGLTPEQAAAVMGNISYESGFNPFRANSDSLGAVTWEQQVKMDGPALGLIQWMNDFRQNMLKTLDSNLRQYFLDVSKYKGSYVDESNYQNAISQIGEEAYDAVLAHEIQFLKDTIDDNAIFQRFLSKPTIEEGTYTFCMENERPGEEHCSPSSVSGRIRIEDALKYYNLYKDKSSTSSNTTQDGSNVTIIGDSITVGITNDASKEEIAGTNLINDLSGAYVNAKVGRTWDEGVQVLKDLKDDNNLKNIVVFSLGTNNADGISKDDVQQVYDIVGENRKLVLVTNYTNVDSAKKGYKKTNEIIKSFASTHPNVSILNYADVLSSDPSKYIGSDNIHPSAEGRQKYLDLLLSAIRHIPNNPSSVLCGNGATQGSGNLSETAIALAWPYDVWTKDEDNYIDKASPAYKDALLSVYGGYGQGGQGLACNQFVATVVIYSGVDPDFNKGVTDNQSIYMESNPSLWSLISEIGTAKTTENILPGDIFVNNAHIWMAAMDKDGVIKRVQASLDTETGLVKNAVSSVLNYAQGFRQFRFIGRIGD